MKQIGKILCGVGALWATLTIGSLQAAVTDNTADDPKKMNTCLAMSPDALSQDSDCADIMKRKNITVAEMQTIKTCKAMKPDLMATDQTCTALSSKYPDVMRPTLQ